MFATIQKLYTTNYTDQSDFDGQDSGHTFLGDVRSRILSRAGVNASPLGPGGFCWSFPSSILASKTHQVDFGMDSRHSHISALFSLLQSSQSSLSSPPSFSAVVCVSACRFRISLCPSVMLHIVPFRRCLLRAVVIGYGTIGE
jgi:hypothetical protein